MDRKASTVVATAAASVLLAFAAFFVFRAAASHESKASASQAPSLRSNAEPAVDLLPPPPVRIVSPAPSAPAPEARDALLLDEAALMASLRELRGSDPNLTLRRAREGNRRFKNRAGVAERSWFIVKALSDLGRHDEARIEGRALVDQYRETRWAEDVYRHLFVNPPTHPFERGYGKKLESDP
jgi:hypothetical protein